MQMSLRRLAANAGWAHTYILADKRLTNLRLALLNTRLDGAEETRRVEWGIIGNKAAERKSALDWCEITKPQMGEGGNYCHFKRYNRPDVRIGAANWIDEGKSLASSLNTQTWWKDNESRSRRGVRLICCALSEPNSGLTYTAAQTDKGSDKKKSSAPVCARRFSGLMVRQGGRKDASACWVTVRKYAFDSWPPRIVQRSDFEVKCSVTWLNVPAVT